MTATTLNCRRNCRLPPPLKTPAFFTASAASTRYDLISLVTVSGEIIFDQMFREASEFTVIPFGYESTVPEIAQFARLVEHKEVLESIRNTPDFALISHNQKQVFLVEVKFRTRMSSDEILKTAGSTSEAEQSSWSSLPPPPATKPNYIC